MDSLNDFELPYTNLSSEAYGIYIPGTEWGGVFEFLQTQTQNETAVIKGWNWRGLLTQDIIEPSEGSDYKVVTGEANTILRELLSNVLGGFFHVPEVDSGLNIQAHQFKLHISYLEGLIDMLSEHGYRLKIYAKREKEGEPITAFCEAVPSSVAEGEYNDDNGLNMTFTDNRMGINHLICYGKGELQERQRMDLYLQKDGTIGTEPHYIGFLERKAVYENSNAESLEALEKDARKRFKEICSKKTLDFDADELETEMDIGDIVRGRHRASGIILEKPIVRKILKYTNDTKSLEYAVKGEG